MPEDDFETPEFKEALEEARGTRWLKPLSLATALIAVLAAIAGLESGALSNEALMHKNDALLAQAHASDQWAFYQAKGIKAVVYSTQAAALKTSNPEIAEKAQQEAEHYAQEQKDITKTAGEFEAEEKRQNELSTISMEHHHRFAYSVTMFQVGIALSAVAALSRQKLVWFGGLAIAACGLVFFVDGFRLFF